MGTRLGRSEVLQRPLPGPSVNVMRRTFEDRDDLCNYLRELFPHAAGDLSPIVGGGAPAEVKLQGFPVQQYAASRNFLAGSVSGLSPYIRHGVLTLREVKDYFTGQSLAKLIPAKFIQELAWRDYWQRVYYEIGDGVWEDREPSRTGLAYQPNLPGDCGATGLACMDAFVADLAATGYLHNHARMWLAAYLIHWRRVAWQTGARWFLQHLLDGDPGSNNLSWQWVASTFSAKPYFFNRDNLERYTAGQYCASCSLRDRCPFDKSYEQLEGELFRCD